MNIQQLSRKKALSVAESQKLLRFASQRKKQALGYLKAAARANKEAEDAQRIIERSTELLTEKAGG